MRVCVQILLATGLSVCLSLPAAAGTLYRWVDEKGTVNYSSEAPAISGRVRTVTQHSMAGYDGAAVLAASERQNRELQARLDRLQREVEELKQARVSASAPALPPQLPPQLPQPVASNPNPCDGDPRTNCSRGHSPEYVYVQVFYPTVVVGARPRPLPPFYVVPPLVPGKPVTHKHHHSMQPTATPASGVQVNYRAGSTVRTHY